MLEYCSGAKKFSRAIDLDGLRCHICCLQTRKCNEKEKTSLESEFAYFQWSRSFQLPRFAKCKQQLKQSLQELTPSEQIHVQKEKKNSNRLFKSSIKRKTRHSQHAVGVLWRQKMNKKSVEQQVQSCCLAYSTFCFYDVLFAVAVAVVASYGLFTWRCGGGGGGGGNPRGGGEPP